MLFAFAALTMFTNIALATNTKLDNVENNNELATNKTINKERIIDNVELSLFSDDVCQKLLTETIIAAENQGYSEEESVELGIAAWNFCLVIQFVSELLPY